MISRPARMHGTALIGTISALAMLLLPLVLAAQSSEKEKNRKIAAAQHEMVLILIKKKEYAKAAEEANKIFQLSWSDDEESLLKTELLRFSDLFHHSEQNVIALQLVERNLARFKSPAIRADILKQQAYLLELMGEHDKAIDCLRESNRLLEKKLPLP